MKPALFLSTLTMVASIAVVPSLLAQNTPTKLTQPVVNAQAQAQAQAQAAAEEQRAARDARFKSSYGTTAPRAPQAAAAPVAAPMAPPTALPVAAPAQPGAKTAAPVAAPAPARKSDPEREQRIINFQRQNAVSGNPSSQYDLGMRYVKGDGVEKDDKQAMEWLKLAAQNGNSRAQKELTALEARIATNGTPASAAPSAPAAAAAALPASK